MRLAELRSSPLSVSSRRLACRRSMRTADRRAPYAGMQGRPVKALSEQQVADLRAGKGMSLALPAELNGYPGPLHTLELAEPLRLSATQRARTQELFTQMQREAQAVGEEVIAAETALDTLFREKRATAEAVAAATAHAAQVQARLRQTHLRYHLAMMDVLSTDQVAAYNRLRGYRQRIARGARAVLHAPPRRASKPRASKPYSARGLSTRMRWRSAASGTMRSSQSRCSP